MCEDRIHRMTFDELADERMIECERCGESYDGSYESECPECGGFPHRCGVCNHTGHADGRLWCDHSSMDGDGPALSEKEIGEEIPEWCPLLKEKP